MEILIFFLSYTKTGPCEVILILNGNYGSHFKMCVMFLLNTMLKWKLKIAVASFEVLLTQSDWEKKISFHYVEGVILLLFYEFLDLVPCYFCIYFASFLSF